MRNLFIILLIVSCATPTKYQKKHKGEGYVDGKLGEINFTEFHANSYTKLKNAITMAQYRATQVCLPNNTYFLGSDDLSQVKNIIRTSGTTTTPFFSSGYYSHRRGSSLGIGFGTYSSESWQDKQVYPKPRMYYLCGNEFFAPPGEFREVSPKELGYVYKDLIGAIVVDKSQSSSSLRKGDIILRLSNERVERLFEFYYHFQMKHQEDVEILRDGKRMKINVVAINITDKVKNYNKELSSKMCELDDKYCPKKD